MVLGVAVAELGSYHCISATPDEWCGGDKRKTGRKQGEGPEFLNIDTPLNCEQFARDLHLFLSHSLSDRLI